MPSQYESISKGLILLLVVILSLSWYYVSFQKNQVIIKALFVCMVMIGIFTNFVTWLLVALMLNSNSKIWMIVACLIGLVSVQVHWLLMEKCCISYSFSVRNTFMRKASNKMIILNIVQTLSLIIKCIMTYSSG